MGTGTIAALIAIGVVSCLLASALIGTGRLIIAVCARLLQRRWRGIRKPEWMGEAAYILREHGILKLLRFLKGLPHATLGQLIGLDSLGEGVIMVLGFLGAGHRVALYASSLVSGLGSLGAVVAAALAEGSTRWLGLTLIALFLFRLFCIPLSVIQELREIDKDK